METKEKVLNMNIQAVQQSIRMMNSKIDEQNVKINGFVSTISTMQTQLNSMNQRLAIQAAKSFGSGSTVI